MPALAYQKMLYDATLLPQRRSTALLVHRKFWAKPVTVILSNQMSARHNTLSFVRIIVSIPHNINIGSARILSLQKQKPVCLRSSSEQQSCPSSPLLSFMCCSLRSKTWKPFYLCCIVAADWNHLWMYPIGVFRMGSMSKYLPNLESNWLHTRRWLLALSGLQNLIRSHCQWMNTRKGFLGGVKRFKMTKNPVPISAAAFTTSACCYKSNILFSASPSLVQWPVLWICYLNLLTYRTKGLNSYIELVEASSMSALCPWCPHSNLLWLLASRWFLLKLMGSW